MYNNKVSEAIEKRDELVRAYLGLTDNEQYQSVKQWAPFELTNAKHACEVLALVKDADAPVRMTFSSAEEARQLFAQIMGVKKKAPLLLEAATMIVSAAEAADAVNDFVDGNPYLPSGTGVSKQAGAEEVARECLEVLPDYPSLLTRKFKTTFVESCLSCLSFEDVSSLVVAKIIVPADLDHVRLVGEGRTAGRYQDNLSKVCALFGRGVKVLELENQHLKGVSFKNADGTDRQALILGLKRDAEQGYVELDVENTTYVPEDGRPEPAAEVSYKGQRIGFIAADLVKRVHSEFESPTFSVQLEEVTGQGTPGTLYGCDVTVKVTAYGVAKGQTHEREEVSAEDIPVEVE